MEEWIECRNQAFEVDYNEIFKNMGNG